jgi:hypothetical protein
MQNDIAMSVAIYQRLKMELCGDLLDITGQSDIADDDQVLLDTLEGITDVHEQVAALIRDARRAKAMAKGLAEIIKEGQSRKSRLEVRSERLRKFAFDAMQECGIPKVEACDLTISIGKGVPSVIITNDDCVPDALCKIERTPKKNEIAELLKSGEFVPYATMSNAPPTLVVRSK